MDTKISNDPKEYYKHLSLFWTDLLHLMFSKPQALTSVGPMRSYTENAKKITAELLESNEILTNFNQHLTEYYKQLGDTWNDAQKKVNSKNLEVPSNPEQFEAYKKSGLIFLIMTLLNYLIQRNLGIIMEN